MATFNPADPDAALVPVFKASSVLNPSKSAAAGRKIHDDVEIVEIRKPGTQNFTVQRAHDRACWQTDPYTGEQTEVTYAQRFRHQYEQFKAHQAQTKSGTPLDEVAFLTEARRAELKAQNIYTVEALAQIDGNELKNLGFGGRELKNQAEEYIKHAKQNAPDLQVLAELEALRARNLALEQDVEALKVRKPDNQFNKMTLEQLREFVEAAHGEPLQGFMAKPTLLRMAQDAQAKIDARAKSKAAA